VFHSHLTSYDFPAIFARCAFRREKLAFLVCFAIWQIRAWQTQCVNGIQSGGPFRMGERS
jgi:hypothetical protein